VNSAPLSECLRQLAKCSREMCQAQITETGMAKTARPTVPYALPAAVFSTPLPPFFLLPAFLACAGTIF